MDNLSEKIEVELGNIDEVLNVMPPLSRLPYLFSLELAGVATLLHNFYNGVENILKQIFASKRIPIPEGSSWHKDLLETAASKKIIPDECRNNLIQYLAFRHFFSHAYALDLHRGKMELLVENSKESYSLFKKEINSHE